MVKTVPSAVFGLMSLQRRREENPELEQFIQVLSFQQCNQWSQREKLIIKNLAINCWLGQSVTLRSTFLRKAHLLPRATLGYFRKTRGIWWEPVQRIQRKSWHQQEKRFYLCLSRDFTALSTNHNSVFFINNVRSFGHYV